MKNSGWLSRKIKQNVMLRLPKHRAQLVRIYESQRGERDASAGAA
jgi:hypothetical protein